MRENCMHGSEGGAVNARPYPYQKAQAAPTDPAAGTAIIERRCAGPSSLWKRIVIGFHIKVNVI